MGQSIAFGAIRQRVCAAVVGAATDEQLDDWARQHLAPPKRPKTWTHVPDLPRTATGKVRRDQLAPHRQG